MSLPEPMTPPDCDLRGLPFMPLQVGRLLDSDLFIKSTGDQFKAALALWCKSWNQIPGGSLPDDDLILEDLSRSKQWKKVKEMALRGWVKCSDGRLYHPVVAENARKAWDGRMEHQEVQTNKVSRQQRWRDQIKALSAQLRDAGVTPPMNPTKSELERLIALHVDGTVDGTVDGQTSTKTSTDASTVDQPETAIKGQGQCKGQTTSVPKGTGGKPPLITDPIEIIFGYGLALLTNAGTAEKQARSFLGGLRKHHGDEALIDKLRECAKAKPLQPLEWLAAALPPGGSAAKPGKHAGFQSLDYSKGVNPDGTFV